jgi:hypothetical protein
VRSLSSVNPGLLEGMVALDRTDDFEEAAADDLMDDAESKEASLLRYCSLHLR